MFVPCDDEGNVLECPGKYSDKKWTEEEMANWGGDINEYQQSKEKVLFEGFKIYHHNDTQQWLSNGNGSIFLDKSFALRNEIIEELIDMNVTLTQSAIKQLGL